MRTIETTDDLAEGLAWLARTDGRLAAVIDAAGDLPLRRREAGFAGLARIAGRTARGDPSRERGGA